MNHGKRIERVKQELVEQEKDAFIVSGAADVQYFSGFEVYADGGTRGWYPLVVIPQEGEPVLLVGGLDRYGAEETAEIEYTVPEDSFSGHVEELLGAGAEILVDRNVSAGFYSNFSEYFSLEFSSLVRDMRMVKDDDEIEQVRAAYRITEEVFSDLLSELGAGQTESAIAGDVEHGIRARGGIAAFPSVVASGSRSSHPHHAPGTVEVEKGPLLFDIGARLRGYVSDFSRTIFLGEPPEPFTGAYEAVREAQEAGEKVIKAGATASKVDDTIRESLEASGYEHQFPHASGHGIGLSIHEAPKLSFSSDEELEEGMIVTLEPGMYLEGEFGIRIEDAYLVAENGAERLTSRTRQLDDHIIDV